MDNRCNPIYDTDEFYQRWHSGETLKSIADWIGVNISCVAEAAAKRGFKSRRFHQRDALMFRSSRKAS